MPEMRLSVLFQPDCSGLCVSDIGDAVYAVVMAAEGPPSTPCGADFGKRRGWWAFVHHDVVTTIVPTVRDFSDHGACARHDEIASTASTGNCSPRFGGTP